MSCKWIQISFANAVVMPDCLCLWFSAYTNKPTSLPTVSKQDIFNLLFANSSQVVQFINWHLIKNTTHQQRIAEDSVFMKISIFGKKKMKMLAFSSDGQTVVALPVGTTRPALGLVEAMTLPETTWFSTGRGLSPQLAMFLGCLADPLGVRVTTNSFMERIH